MSPPRERANRNINLPGAFYSILVLALTLPSAGFGQSEKGKRAIDPKAPDRTVPIQKGPGEQVGGLEDLIEQMSASEAKVESKQIKPEEHAKLVESAVQKTAAAVQAFPESPAVNVSAARVMIQAGKFEEARQYADRAAELAPDDPWPVVNRGIAEFESCDFPAASRSALEALRRDARNQNARAMWSLSQRPAGCNNLTDRLKTRYVGGKMLEMAAPGRTPMLDMLGGGGPSFDAGGAVGQAEAAPVGPGASSGDRYTREGFQRFQALMNGAGNALKGGNNERAFDLATAAILAYPENPTALYIRGIAATHLNRLDNVITDATWGVKLDPKNQAQWLAMRANAESASGRFDAALADALAAVRIDPTRADAWLALAKVKESLQHPIQDWLADYEKAARLNPVFANVYQEALARAQTQQAQPRGSQTARWETGFPSDRRLLIVGTGAIGGLLLAWGAISVFRRSKRNDDEG